MKISVFFDHIVQANEQNGKALKKTLGEIKKAGVQGVEICLDYLIENKEVMDMLKEAELEISCIYGFYEMNKRDESERAKKHINMAVKAKAKRILVVPGFLENSEAEIMQTVIKDREKNLDFMNRCHDIQQMIRGLEYIVKLGIDNNISVTVEDFDDNRSFLSGTNGLIYALNNVPGLKCTFDMGNFICVGENVMEAFDILKENIVHVHCKDRRKEDNGCLATGKGYIPIATLIGELKKTGYDDYLAIEHFDIPKQEENIKYSAAFLRDIINQKN